MAPPRRDLRRQADREFDRKLAQLCRQVEHHLSLVLAELDDEVLSSLTLVGVHSSPDGSRLLLSVLPDSFEGEAPSEVLILARLAEVRGRLREEVAAAIHRRRTPSLDFRVAKDWELDESPP